MKRTAVLIFLIYVLSSLLVLFSLTTIFYPYLAALGSIDLVLNAISDSRILTALFLSILSSIVTTVLALIFGIPLAYVFATKEFAGKDLVETLTIDIPQTFPPIAEGMIFFCFLDQTRQ
ncbi:MAG: hypothetical protein ACP5N9_01285 [Candidatus Bilamarchaeum sp.]